MEPMKPYEQFPAAMILVSILVTISLYAVGAAILSGFGIAAIALYLLYCLGVEFHIMQKSCVDCWYYGKWCAFGKGKAAPLFFAKGDPTRFSAGQITWKQLLPDMLAALVPLVGGEVLLVLAFSWSTALLIVALVVLSFGGNYVVRSKIACKYCKQREIGCPAERYFAKRLE